jgi:hypothetical protein
MYFKEKCVGVNTTHLAVHGVKNDKGLADFWEYLKNLGNSYIFMHLAFTWLVRE